jgi:hypothetical protein
MNSRLIGESLDEVTELMANGIISEADYDEFVKALEKDESLVLRFKHINVHESFTTLTQLFIKISDTQAVGINENVCNFDADEEISKIKKISVESFFGGASNIDYDYEKFIEYKEKRIARG